MNGFYGNPSGVIMNGHTGCYGFQGPYWPDPVGPPGGTPIPVEEVGGTTIPAVEVLPDPAVGLPELPQISNPSVPILEGRSQGVPGEAGDVALRQGRLDASYGVHRPELFSHEFQRTIYEQGWRENQGAQANPSSPDSTLCDPDAAYRATLYNWEIILGKREGSMTFAPGSSHVVDCPEKWAEIEARVARELGVTPETIGAIARGEQPKRTANPAGSQEHVRQELRVGSPWSYRTANDEGYPWAASALHAKNYPMPGTFFDANNPQGAYVFKGTDSFLRALLGSALVMAEMDTSLATSSAGAPLRKQLADLQASGEYNDGLYGTSTTSLVGGRRGLGPRDRGINWEPRHAPIRTLIANGQKLYRTTDIKGQRLPAHIEASHRPLVWNPAINLAVLRNERRITVEGMHWPDGRSMLDPPSSVSALGIDTSSVRFPGGMGQRKPQAQHGSAKDWWNRT